MLALQIEGYSNRPAAQLGDIPIAAPRAGEVRVRVEAAALNPLAAVLVGSSPCKILREFPQHDKRGTSQEIAHRDGVVAPRSAWPGTSRLACVVIRHEPREKTNPLRKPIRILSSQAPNGPRNAFAPAIRRRS